MFAVPPVERSSSEDLASLDILAVEGARDRACLALRMEVRSRDLAMLTYLGSALRLCWRIDLPIRRYNRLVTCRGGDLPIAAIVRREKCH